MCGQCKEKPVRLRAGRNVRYCSSTCYGNSIKNPFIIKKGYKRVLCKDHPRTDAKGYVREHLLIMEQKIGRPVKESEVVHHIDGNKLNNHPDNLKLLSSQSEHMKLHLSTGTFPSQ